MEDRRPALGRSGEAKAVRWLERRGWVILARRWRCRLGELDVVGLDGDTLVFVEVKTRSSALFGPPEEAVGGLKRRRIVRTALSYVKKLGYAGRALRFDVMALCGDEVRHIPGAFGAGGYTC